MSCCVDKVCNFGCKIYRILEVFCKVFFSVNDRAVAQYFTILGV